MSWTKRQFVHHALEELGIANYEFTLEEDQRQFALRKLDAMLATWNAKGIRLGYPLHGSPEDATLEEETGVPDAATEAIYTNLAIRLAPAFGKTAQAETRWAAYSGYMALISKVAKRREIARRAMPAGAGNKGWRNTEFLSGPSDELELGHDDVLDLE